MYVLGQNEKPVQAGVKGITLAVTAGIAWLAWAVLKKPKKYKPRSSRRVKVRPLP